MIRFSCLLLCLAFQVNSGETAGQQRVLTSPVETVARLSNPSLTRRVGNPVIQIEKPAAWQDEKPLVVQEEQPWTASEKSLKKFSKRNGFNYDEAKIPDYELPDPLVANDGSAVTTASQWNGSRREEVINLFREHVYGHRPQAEYEMSFRQISETADALDGKATGRSMVAEVRMGERKFSWPFVLFLPNKATQPVPAVILINNRYFIPLKKAATESDPFWSVEEMIDRGFATASFHTSDVDPDSKLGYAKGIRAFFVNGSARKANSWGSLSAWGWAASRILDHLETLDSVDAKRVAVVGHSRGGKTSLWAAAEDTRFAIAYSNNSGCGGAALSRRAYGETVGRISSTFPHWFCKNYASYAGKENELPVDQHELIGLIAPRGVYVASADEDLWADPRGEYLALIHSAPVFRILGKTTITIPDMPALNRPRVMGPTGYHIRTGGHNLTAQDWKWFLDFADKIFK